MKIKRVKTLALAHVGAALLLAFESRQPSLQQGDLSEAQKGLQNGPIEPFQTELLSIGFGAASSFPVSPHIKNRSRAQMRVVDAALELDQPLLAREYLRNIGNWRRGLGLANLAYYAADRGALDEMRPLIGEAQKVANAGEGVIDQAWRRDLILVRVAQAQALAGDVHGAKASEAELSSMSQGTLIPAIEGQELEKQLALIEASLISGDLDSVRSSLSMGAHLYGLHFGDNEIRIPLETTLRNSWSKAPREVAIDLILNLAQHALEHAEQAKALALVEEAQGLLDAVKWVAHDHIKLVARIVELRIASGNEQRARRDLDSAQREYVEQRDAIVDIWRAQTVLALAEAYQAFGDSSDAMELYRLAAEESLENPNSRPRCNDLVALCISLSTHGIKPEESLMRRLQEIRQGLGEPW